MLVCDGNFLCLDLLQLDDRVSEYRELLFSVYT